MRSMLRRALRFPLRWDLLGPRKQAVIVLACSGVFGIGLSALTHWFSVSCVPDVPCVTLAELADGAPLPEAIHLYDRYGTPLADIAGPLRRSLPPSRITPRLAAAWVAVEDRRFWKHGGIDYLGVVRAAGRDLAARRIEEGASTIEMQLVRTLWAPSLEHVGAWRRKIIEARTAPMLLDRLGRRRILELYLNSIYLGDGVYGVDAASHDYFGVAADSMDLAQIATLVGMTRTPERYQPRKHPNRAVRRRNVVLDVLADAGVVSREAADAAKARKLVTVDAPRRMDRRTYATAAVTRAIRQVAPDLAGQPGLRVFTTLDPEIQRAGENALRRQLAAIEAGRYGPTVDADSAGPLEGAAVAIDPWTGAVRAWIGGRDFEESQFDRVAQAQRQVGSLVKPFLVAAALERGLGILDLVSSDTISLPVHDGVWSPRDHVDDTILPMREALIHSSNRAAVHLGLSIGVAPVRRISQAMGIATPIRDVPSSFLGSFDASLLDMTTAYAAFDDGGLRVEPHLLDSIAGPDGMVKWRYQPPAQRTRVLSTETSFVVLDALRDVVDRGTAVAVRATGYDGPAAGKTGTTDGVRDAWFIGLTPDMAAGVWIGYDRPRTITRHGSGGGLAGPVWGRWMQAVHRQLGEDSLAWLPPPGVRPVRYDPATGNAYDADCRFAVDSPYETAYIQEDHYLDIGRCPGGLYRWLDALWTALAPRKVRSLWGHDRHR